MTAVGRRVRIVATIGPASSAPEVLDALVAAGMDVARLNASHGGPEGLEPLLEAVRAAAERAGRHVAVMLDLSGPKVRLGEVRDGTELADGEAFELLSGPGCAGDSKRACVSHAGLAADVREGDAVLLDDGRVRLRVERTEGPSVFTRVEHGGPIRTRAGVNVAGRTLSVEAVTDKDLADLAWGLDAGVDLVAQSFVRTAADVEKLRSAMGDRAVPIVAKIEKHEALDALPEIVAAADAVMVARGDLGAETSPEQVPVVQRTLVRMAREAGRPVVIATEMLQSMITADRPTRAEASDVASAVFQRADAVMLSGETAVGEHPVEAVAAAARIAEAAEGAITPGEQPDLLPAAGDVTQAMSRAVCGLAESLGAAAIVTATQSGATARAVARHRPATPVLAVTPSPEAARRLAMVWGVRAVVAPGSGSIEETFAGALAAVRDAGLARKGDLVALTAGLAVGVAGATDTVQVRRVG